MSESPSHAAADAPSATPRRKRTRLALAIVGIAVVIVAVAIFTASESPNVDVIVVAELPRPDRSLHVGDAFRVVVRPQNAAHVYAALVHVAEHVVVPLVPADPASAPPRFEAGLERKFPSDAPLAFTGPGGDVALVSLASREPLGSGEWAAMLDRLKKEDVIVVLREFVAAHHGLSGSLSPIQLEG